MALLFEAWQADGKGQVLLKSMRSDSVGYSHQGRDLWFAEQKHNPLCVLITKSRTDKANNYEHILWQKPGYADPCV